MPHDPMLQFMQAWNPHIANNFIYSEIEPWSVHLSSSLACGIGYNNSTCYQVVTKHIQVTIWNSSRETWFIFSVHCKFQSVKATQNSHNSHTKIEFSTTIVVILCDIHTLEFAVYCRRQRGDLIEAYKIFNGCYDIDPTSLFTLSNANGYHQRSPS